MAGREGQPDRATGPLIAILADIDAFYSHEYREEDRLARNRLELVRTRELLRARLPQPPARVLDVGGGTGVHAQWLVQDGYAVTLIDLVATHVDAARARGLDARQGDARALEDADDSADATLLLGPLYHLPDPADRARALAEAARVTRPGGLVAAAAIARTAWPLYALRDDGPLDALDATLATGAGDPVGTLPDAYSHHPRELAGELRAAGLDHVTVVGIEGPAWPFRDVPEDRALALARLADAHPDLAGSSAHLLACGRS